MFVNHVLRLCFYIAYLHKNDYKITRKFIDAEIGGHKNKKTQHLYLLLPQLFVVHYVSLFCIFFIFASFGRAFISILLFGCIVFGLYMILKYQNNYIVFRKLVCFVKIIGAVNKFYWTYYGKHNNLDTIFYTFMNLHKHEEPYITQNEESKLQYVQDIIEQLYEYTLLVKENDKHQTFMALYKMLDSIEDPQLKHRQDPFNGKIELCLYKNIVSYCYVKLLVNIDNNFLVYKFYKRFYSNDTNKYENMFKMLNENNIIVKYYDFYFNVAK